MRVVEDANRWQTKSLRDLATINYGRSPAEILADDGPYPVVGTGGGERLGNDYLHEGDSIILGRKGTIDCVYFATGRFWTIDTAYYLSGFGDTVPRWLFYYLQTLDLRQMNEATGVPSLSRDLLYKIEIPTPSKPEQVKIAEILSTVDRAIEQTEALIAKQQRIKTGLMQDLLTRGIDEHGNLRTEQTHKFKDFPLGRIPVEWEVDVFGNRVDLVHGHQFRKYDFTEAGLPVVKIGQVTEKGLNISGCSYVSPTRENEFSAYRIEEGDVLMALTGATLGKVCRVSSDFRSKFLLQNYRVGRFEPKLPNDLDKTYLYFLLQTNRLLNQVFSRVNSGAQGNVGKADFEKAVIVVPRFDEQQKAGELLLLNDRRKSQLEATWIKLHALKTALMQDLLTGKKRVTSLLVSESKNRKNQEGH